MLRQTISQKMLQKLSPQQIQFMKLLQVPTATLDQRIKEELEVNPALEEGVGEKDDLLGDNQEKESDEESFELDEYIQDYLDDDPSSYKLLSDNYGGDEEDKQMHTSRSESVHLCSATIELRYPPLNCVTSRSESVHKSFGRSRRARWTSGECLIWHARRRQLRRPTQQTRPRSIRIPGKRK